MNLIEAIICAITENGQVGFSDLARYINEKRLYLRIDNKPVSVNQLRQKVSSNPDIFKLKDEKIILLADSDIQPDDESVLNEPSVKYISEDEDVELDVMFHKMLDILWNCNFKGSPELHISSLYFYAVIPLISTEAIENIKFKKFNEIYILPKKNRIKEYIVQLTLLNKTSFFNGLFSEILKEKNLIIESEEDYLKLLFLINDFEVTILKDLSLGEWLNDFISAFSNSDYSKRLYSTPEPIRNIISSLAGTLRFESLYDPAAGTGGLLVDIIRSGYKGKVYCQEINKGIFPLLRMNLLSNCSNGLFFENSDSLRSDFIQPYTAEFIVSDLPWEIKRKTFSAGIKKAGRKSEVWSEELFIKDALVKLSETGKALFNVSFGFLFSENTLQIRKYLVDNDLIEAIVSVSPGLYKPFSNQRSAVLYINKDKQVLRKDKVLFIELKSAMSDLESIEELKGTFYNWKTEEDFSAVADKKRLNLYEYSLMPSRYLQDALNFPLRTGESLVSLSEILSDFKGKNYRWNSGDTVLPFLKVGSLSNSFEDAYVSMAQGELSGRSNQKGTLINESVLLVSRVGDKLKPQYFQFKETPVVINPNILAFTLDQDKIGIEYLILELKSKFFTDQLNGIKRYIGIPNFSRVELKKLFIRLPAKKRDQEIKVKEQKEIYLGELEAQLKLKKEKLIGNQSQFDLVSTIKHNLSQKLAVLNNDIDYIRQTFQNSDNESINIHKPLNDLTDESVMEIITRMGQMVDDSKDTLLKTENYIRIANTENRSEQINLIEFLEKKIIPKYVGNASFRISVVYSEDDKSLAVVFGSSFLLSELFTNFIQNAINHGFVDDTRVYEICFHVTADLKSELIRILISNDGYQLPDDFTIETLLKFGERSGETSGTGIGGAVIGKILDILGGEVHIPPHTELSHSRYLVNFEVNLPLNSIKLQ